MTWVTSVPSSVFIGLSVLELGPMYATDRQTSDVRQKHRLMPPPIGGGGHNKTINDSAATDATAVRLLFKATMNAALQTSRSSHVQW